MLTMIFALLTSMNLHAQSDRPPFWDTLSPCQQAIARAKEACGKYVGQDMQKADALDQETDQKKRCGKYQQMKPGSDSQFQKICGDASSQATQSCSVSNSGGATGDNGAIQMTDDLNDLNQTMETFRGMHKDRWTRKECSDVPMS